MIAAHSKPDRARLAKAGETKRDFLEIDFSQLSKGTPMEKAVKLSLMRKNISLARSLGVPMKIKEGYSKEELFFLFSLITQEGEKGFLQHGKPSLSLLL
ncbi:MAG: hypothetical protein QW035_00820 [Candidatus Anstonellales archaeon]